jgi:hypothetical protein
LFEVVVAFLWILLVVLHKNKRMYVKYITTFNLAMILLVIVVGA